METILFSIEKTRSGRPAIWVGGGATSNRFAAQFVLRDKKLAPACFIKTSGHRCNSNQALVPIREGDVIVGIQGTRPASLENPCIGVHGWKVVEFQTNDNELLAVCHKVDISKDDVPPSVWHGCGVYHNRDGRYFIAE